MPIVMLIVLLAGFTGGVSHTPPPPPGVLDSVPIFP